MLPFLTKTFGLVPDLLMGKDPKDALRDNIAQGALVGGAALAAPAMGGAGATGGLLNFSGTQAAAPIADLSVAASPADVAGIGGSGGAGLSAYAKPAMQGLQGATMAKGLLSQEQQQPQAPQLPQYQDMSGILSANNQQMAQLEAKRMARRQGLLGGVYG